MNATLRMLLEGAGYRPGLCLSFMKESDALIQSARRLRVHLEEFKKAPDPFGALVSTVHNNQEFDRFLERQYDISAPGDVVVLPEPLGRKGRDTMSSVITGVVALLIVVSMFFSGLVAP